MTGLFTIIQFGEYKNSKLVDLTSDDMINIDKLLTECIDKYNIDQEKEFGQISSKLPEDKLDNKNFVINWEKYKKQYIAVINSKGEKEVWINCFCDTWRKEWRKDFMTLIDCGRSYFNLKINLTTKEFYDLII